MVGAGLQRTDQFRWGTSPLQKPTWILMEGRSVIP